MASHHHFHQYCHHQPIPPIPIAAAPTSCYCCTTTTTTTTPSHYPYQSLLYPMASHSSPPPSQPPSMYLNPSHTHCHQPQTHHHRQRPFRKQRDQEQDYELELTHPVISSLLRRISALESSIRNHSSASRSLRDAAASTIQAHFRAFLVRRSRTLRQLKDLAFIKSAVNTLKSDKTHLDPQSLLHKTTDLLLKLDSIEGGDPMIRDGKRSISRELARFIDFLDGFAVKKSVLLSRAVSNVRLDWNINRARLFYSDHKRDTASWEVLERGNKRSGRFEKRNVVSRTTEDSDMEDEESESPILGLAQKRNGGSAKDHGRVQAKVKKCVTFAENGNVYRIISPPRVQDTSEDCGSVDGSGSVYGEREFLESICKVEDVGVSSKETEDGGESQTEDEDEEPSKTSNGERVSGMSQKTRRNFEMLRRDHGKDEGFMFSAPLPAKMESRGDLIN